MICIRKFSLDKYLEVLFQTNEETKDFMLNDDEYIRIVGINAENPDKCFTHYLKTKDEIKTDIKKYGQVFNMYIGLSTTKGKGGKIENMKTRKVLLLDFDRKDYPEFQTAEDFTAHIKSRIPPLFNHVIVDSGHGYHFYIAIRKCVNNERIATISRELAELTGADIKATLPTQIVRIPTSMNLKDVENKKPVNIVANNLETLPDKFKPYHLQRIERYISLYQQNQKNIENISTLPTNEYTKLSSFYCCEAMLSQGARKGERNFCLGRITKYLQYSKGYTEENALRAVLEWNRKCDPPKSQTIVKEDFKRYWNGNYKLLGCKIPNESHQNILNRFCDKTMCNSIFEPRNNSTVEEDEEMYFDNSMLKNKIMRGLSGYHYMILSVLDFMERPARKKTLEKALTERRSPHKCCISHVTLKKCLDDLVNLSYVIYDNYSHTYEINKEKKYAQTYTKYCYGATIQLVNKIITPTEYLVYLCLVRNLQQNKNVTYETIADNLNMDESNIGKYIRGLHQAGIIKIDIGYNQKGLQYNAYRILH